MDPQEDNQPAEPPASDPSVNDVLAQQMGTDYANVENLDKEALQKELQDQGTTPEDVRSDDITDDRNTSDGQLIGN
jgi:hypothetical protein